MSDIYKFLSLPDSSLLERKLCDFNSKQKDEQFIYTGLKYNLWWMLFKRLKPLPVDQVPAHPKRQKMIRSIFKRLAWVSWGDVRVAKPSEKEKNLLRENLKNSNQYLYDEFGIDYR